MRLLAWVRERFWLLPALCAVLAGAVGVAMPELDTALLQLQALPPFFLLTGGPEGARPAVGDCQLDGLGEAATGFAEPPRVAQ